ncbi:hypothetical protein FB45DRAFT_124418 [Roridomyces roridus]|uniref:GATA-type domain-containing protein n=1 Tax=Roridomyces roridus TaxID=1738132 RepID=A0AAD7FJF7_9AGAR|nr:hypothetical protein FB45DRAFT_124418 [Roridomyces roridus]
MSTTPEPEPQHVSPAYERHGGHSSVSSPPVHSTHSSPSRVSVGGSSGSILFTDDVATKPSETIHRRCFTCRTVQTSVWRRSVLSVGKVLCNKCGLHERIHSCPRPADCGQRKRKIKRGAGGTKSQTDESSAHPYFCLPQNSNGDVSRYPYNLPYHPLAACKLEQHPTDYGTPFILAWAPSEGVMVEDSTVCEGESSERVPVVVQNECGKKRLREEDVEMRGSPPPGLPGSISVSFTDEAEAIATYRLQQQHPTQNGYDHGTPCRVRGWAPSLGVMDEDSTARGAIQNGNQKKRRCEEDMDGEGAVKKVGMNDEEGKKVRQEALHGSHPEHRSRLRVLWDMPF